MVTSKRREASLFATHKQQWGTLHNLVQFKPTATVADLRICGILPRKVFALSLHSLDSL
jgi:hypothetical protein